MEQIKESVITFKHPTQFLFLVLPKRFNGSFYKWIRNQQFLMSHLKTG